MSATVLDATEPNQAAPVRPSAVERWDELVDWVLIPLALIFIAAYALPILIPDVDTHVQRACSIVTWVTWAAFAGDFVVRLSLAERKRRFLLAHAVDLVIVLLPAVPALQLLRLVMVLRVLNRHASFEFRGRLIFYIAGGAVLLANTGALAVLAAERTNPDANIAGFGDAIWWAVTTMSTTGYGDRYPTTTEGRIVAVALQIGGVAIFSTVTSSVGYWFGSQIRSAEKVKTVALEARLDRQQQMLEALLTNAGIAIPAEVVDLSVGSTAAEFTQVSAREALLWRALCGALGVYILVVLVTQVW